MSAPSFQTLFSPLQVRGLKLKNRIFSPAHGMTLGRDGLVSGDMIRSHEARAGRPARRRGPNT